MNLPTPIPVPLPNLGTLRILDPNHLLLFLFHHYFQDTKIPRYKDTSHSYLSPCVVALIAALLHRRIIASHRQFNLSDQYLQRGSRSPLLVAHRAHIIPNNQQKGNLLKEFILQNLYLKAYLSGQKNPRGLPVGNSPKLDQPIVQSSSQSSAIKRQGRIHLLSSSQLVNCRSARN